MNENRPSTESGDESAVYTARFTFVPGEYDDEFHRLNDRIDEAAKDSPDFLRKEWWESPDGEALSVIYYWASLEALKTFSKHPDHIEAKRRYDEWYEGYEVEIAKLIDHRGDGRLDRE